MELTAPELWSRALEAARSRLPEQSFRTWLSATTATGLTDSELLVDAPSEFHAQWLEDKYGARMQGIVGSILGRPLKVRFRYSGRYDEEAFPSVEVAAPTDSHPKPSPSGEPKERESKDHPRDPAAQAGGRRATDLNERYTFARFVVGNNNQLASAASHAVAQKPARVYNPLFVYGGVGLGKTHLMHAIGNEIVQRDPSKQVAYVPTEQFTNELVSAIQEGTTGSFRRRYREMDLLLVDDIHFLARKEATQEEFFHTFNALYDARKQIVLTSDRPPKEIPGLEDRLVSRFEWGLVADIKSPDYETRVAILRKKADDDQLVLDDEVIDFIARSCTSSVRELEGAVIKLLAYSSLRKEEINLNLARTALASMLPGGASGGAEPLTPQRIRDAVATHWNVPAAALSSKRRSREIALPRQVAMYLIKELLDLSLVRIGEFFGGRDHSTVIHSIRKVEKALPDDERLRSSVKELRERLGAPGE